MLVVQDTTWLFQNGTWSDITSTAGTPDLSTSGPATLVYDAPARYVLALSAGGCGRGCSPVWALESEKWVQLSESGAPCPVPKGECAATYDPSAAAVIVSSGFGTWTYRNGTWTGSPSSSCGANCTSASRQPNVSGGLAYDAGDGYVLLFGAGSTWKYANGTWSNLTPTLAISPPLRAGILSEENDSDGILLYGASASREGAPQTWLYDSGAWQNVSRSSMPAGGGEEAPPCSTLTWDAADSGVACYGRSLCGPSCDNNSSTWYWGTAPPLAQVSTTAYPSIAEPGQLATFTPHFRGGVAPFSYDWSFGDGNGSSLRIPGHAYPDAGTYDVVLTITDSGGHTARASLLFTVYLFLAITSLTATPNPAPLGIPVTFQPTVVGGTPPLTYAWRFGDGGTGGNLSSIEHAYSTDGPFEAVLEVTDRLGEVAFASINISIVLGAIADASSTTVGPAPLTVAFTGSGEGGYPPYAYSWDFGDGSPNSSLQDPGHTYAIPGVYVVTLTIVDSVLGRATSSIEVSVAAPTAGASAGGRPPAWVAPALGLAGAGLAAVGCGWLIDRVRLRSLRREGESWVSELTDQPGAATGPSEPPPLRPPL